MSTSPSLAPNAERFAPLPPEKTGRFTTFRGSSPQYFPGLIGLVQEEVRLDYARMRMPFRDNLLQPAGVVHGGAIASLIDTVVVPALASAYDEFPLLLTIDMQVQYMGAIGREDAVAEGWVVKRGRSTAFCRAEVRTEASGLVAAGTLVYKIGQPRKA
jgi:uncharacterized protein (TIGR00369 family)